MSQRVHPRVNPEAKLGTLLSKEDQAKYFTHDEDGNMLGRYYDKDAKLILVRNRKEPKERTLNKDFTVEDGAPDGEVARAIALAQDPDAWREKYGGKGPYSLASAGINGTWNQNTKSFKKLHHFSWSDEDVEKREAAKLKVTQMEDLDAVASLAVSGADELDLWDQLLDGDKDLKNTVNWVHCATANAPRKGDTDEVAENKAVTWAMANELIDSQYDLDKRDKFRKQCDAQQRKFGLTAPLSTSEGMEAFVDKEMIRMGMKRSTEEKAKIEEDKEYYYKRLMKRAKTMNPYAKLDPAEEEAKAKARAPLRRYRQFHKTDDDDEEETTEVFQTNATPGAAGTSSFVVGMAGK